MRKQMVDYYPDVVKAFNRMYADKYPELTVSDVRFILRLMYKNMLIIGSSKNFELYISDKFCFFIVRSLSFKKHKNFKSDNYNKVIALLEKRKRCSLRKKQMK